MATRLFAALAVTAGLAATTAVMAPTAQAAAPSDCPSQYLCAYWLPNYTNASGHGVQKVKENNPDTTMWANFYYIQDGSLYNHGASCNATVFTEKNYHGNPYNLNRGTGWANVGSNLPHIESNEWCLY
jgi:Peptidase inhibitor family I36